MGSFMSEQWGAGKRNVVSGIESHQLGPPMALQDTSQRCRLENPSQKRGC